MENVILTKVYLLQMAPVCVWKTLMQKRVVIWHLQGGLGRPYLPMWRMCVLPCVCQGEGVAHYWLVREGYPRWRVVKSCKISSQHSQSTGHCINVDSFPIVGREVQGVTRTIKEAMFIKVNDKSCNRNLGNYHLPHIWDEVLQDFPVLHLRWPSTTSQQQ